MASGKPIIIKRKKGGHHGGHHGGAWKVAYADFVTAMMAFFLVMWILGLSESTRKGISGYFKEPGLFSFTTGKAMPVDLSTGPAQHKGDGSGDTNGKGGRAMRIVHARQKMEKLATSFKASLKQMAKADARLSKLENAVSLEMTPEGLRIELAESQELAFFEVGGARPSSAIRQVLSAIAPELKKLGNPIDIEGHTDRRPYGDSATYTNWELSSDRANAARKILAENGLTEEQIQSVKGYADRKLRKPDEPFDVTNRRVSIVVRYPPADDPSAANDDDDSDGPKTALFDITSPTRRPDGGAEGGQRLADREERDVPDRAEPRRRPDDGEGDGAREGTEERSARRGEEAKAEERPAAKHGGEEPTKAQGEEPAGAKDGDGDRASSDKAAAPEKKKKEKNPFPIIAPGDLAAQLRAAQGGDIRPKK